MPWGIKIPDLKNNPLYLEPKVNELSTFLAQRPTKTYVDDEIAKKANGAPKGVYATVSALQTALPTGSTDNQLVTADGKWYYWNGSAWTAGGIYQTPLEPAVLTFKNLIINGNFVNTSNWAGSASSTISATNNALSIVGNGGSTEVRGSTTGTTGVGTSQAGRKLYLQLVAKVTNDISKSIIVRYYNGVSTSIFTTKPLPIKDTNYILSGIVTEPQTGTLARLDIVHSYATAATSNLQTMDVQNVIVIDLTSTFGLGKEPTTDEMNQILEILGGWFDGEITTEQKEITNLLLTMLRAKPSIADVNNEIDVQLGINSYSTVPTYTNGLLSKVEELDGSTVKSRTILAYNPDGSVNTVTEELQGKTVVSTLVYTNGIVTSVSKTVTEGGL